MALQKFYSILHRWKRWILSLSAKPLPRKTTLFLTLSSILFFYLWLIFAATHTNLPEPQKPILFYSNQTRQDIKQVYLRALQNAERSIFISVYGITDPDILSLLTQKSKSSLPITVEYDPTASGNLKKTLPPSIAAHPIKSKGLMHRKIVTLDRTQVLLGSANLTPTSLKHHDNLVLGIYHPPLAAFLEHPSDTTFSFNLQGQHGEIFLFPDPEHAGLNRLIQSLQDAKSTISIAMFTLTHPEIVEALIQAQNRKVAVSVIVDYYTAKGASKKALDLLAKAGITILTSQGKQLLHHKWALIDNSTFILGSANWTKAAFSKNHDFLLFLSPLPQEQRQFLQRLWDILSLESVEISLQEENTVLKNTRLF